MIFIFKYVPSSFVRVNKEYMRHMSDSSIHQSLKGLYILLVQETNSEIIARVEKRLRMARQMTASR